MIERPAIRVLEDIIADLDDIPNDERTVVSSMSAVEAISSLWNAFLFRGEEREQDDVVIERWDSALEHILAAGGTTIAASLLAVTAVVGWSGRVLDVFLVIINLGAALISGMTSITGLRSKKRREREKSKTRE